MYMIKNTITNMKKKMEKNGGKNVFLIFVNRKVGCPIIIDTKIFYE